MGTVKYIRGLSPEQMKKDAQELGKMLVISKWADDRGSEICSQCKGGTLEPELAKAQKYAIKAVDTYFLALREVYVLHWKSDETLLTEKTRSAVDSEIEEIRNLVTFGKLGKLSDIQAANYITETINYRAAALREWAARLKKEL
jgi:hypothetical protein